MSQAPETPVYTEHPTNLAQIMHSMSSVSILLGRAVHLRVDFFARA